MEFMHTPYAVLGVPDGSSLDVCKKAYRSLGKIYHPDNVATGDAAKFEEINKAFKDIQAGITRYTTPRIKRKVLSHKTIFTFV